MGSWNRMIHSMKHVVVKSIPLKFVHSNAWIKKLIAYYKKSLKKVRIVSIVYNWLKEKMKGRIEEEKIKGQLIDVKNEHQRKEALIDGEAEAERVSAFIKGLNGVCSAEQAIKIFNELRKAEVMTELANSDAHLYFTPAECDLRLGMSTVQDERNGNRGNISKKNANTNQMKL